MKIILLLITVVAFTFYSALIDSEHYAKKQFVKNHYSRWVQRFLFVFAIGVFDIVGGIASALIFTVFFDQILNLLRGLPLMYFGTVSKWDNFWKHNILFYSVAKITLLVIAVLLVFYAKSNLW